MNLNRPFSLASRTSRWLACAAALLLLYGCGSTPSPEATHSNAKTAQQPDININELLTQAQLSQSPAREQLYLQAAKELDRRGEKTWARNILNNIDPDTLTSQHYSEYVLLFSQIALENGSYFLAQRILTNPRLDQQWQQFSPDEQITLHQRRAELFMTLGEAHASIQERQNLAPMLDDPLMQTQNQEALWQTLMTMTEPELEYRLHQAQNHHNQNLQGWYSLALINKRNPANLEQQLQQVYQWMADWPQHPASRDLPLDLRFLKQLVANQPQQIALLLPQQGRLAKAGNAVRDGFMAAYYQASTTGARVPKVRFYDTSNGNIVDLYNQALDEGAELIIGPLDKDLVSRLNEETSLPVTTLAVNYANPTDTSTTKTPVTENLFQFGLSTEDEALQIAKRAWVEGHRYAMILSSEDSWSTRSAETFRQAWESLGGTIIDQSTFNASGNYSDVIKRSLHVDRSERRARDIRSWAGGSMEFEPRRRQDADMLFLIARPQEARQIKPTLAFHYASDLPVYATHHIYNGTPDPKSDRDLDGIRFSTLPWFFEENDPVKQSIQKYANPSASFERLYALGADSFQLYPRLTQLKTTPYVKLHGHTGLLTMDESGHINREQLWAKISSGKARALPRVVSSQDFDS